MCFSTNMKINNRQNRIEDKRKSQHHEKSNFDAEKIKKMCYLKVMSEVIFFTRMSFNYYNECIRPNEDLVFSLWGPVITINHRVPKARFLLMSRRLACDRNGCLIFFILEIKQQHSLMLNTVEYSHQKFNGSSDKKFLVLLI